MINAILKGLLNIIATLIQVVTWPLNELITLAIPDLSEQINQVTTTFNSIFGGIGWALGFIPPILLTTLIFVLTIEICKHTIFVSTHTLLKVWNIFQKIKFW